MNFNYIFILNSTLNTNNTNICWFKPGSCRQQLICRRIQIQLWCHLHCILHSTPEIKRGEIQCELHNVAHVYMSIKTGEGCWEDLKFKLLFSWLDFFLLLQFSVTSHVSIIAREYGQHFSSTCYATLSHCKLKSVVGTYYHPPQTLSRNKILLLQVEKICWKK